MSFNLVFGKYNGHNTPVHFINLPEDLKDLENLENLENLNTIVINCYKDSDVKFICYRKLRRYCCINNIHIYVCLMSKVSVNLFIPRYLDYIIFNNEQTLYNKRRIYYHYYKKNFFTFESFLKYYNDTKISNISNMECIDL